MSYTTNYDPRNGLGQDGYPALHDDRVPLLHGQRAIGLTRKDGRVSNNRSVLPGLPSANCWNEPVSKRLLYVIDRQLVRAQTFAQLERRRAF
jgi:hypothetical protein